MTLTARPGIRATLLAVILAGAFAQAWAEDCTRFGWAPAIVGSHTDLAPGLVDIQGDYLYSRYLGLRIHDISDPANPVLVGTHPGVGPLFGVSVAGDLCVFSRSTSLQAFDVSDPTAPAELAVTAQPSMYHVDVETDGTYTYTAGGYRWDRWTELRVYAWPDSGQWNYLSRLHLHDEVGENTKIELWEGRAFVLTTNLGLFEADVTDPVAAELIATHPYDGQDLCAAGGRLFLARGFDGVQVIDLSTWSVEATIPTTGSAERVTHREDTLYVTVRGTVPADPIVDSSLRLVMYDTSDPSYPWLANVEFGGNTVLRNTAAGDGVVVVGGEQQWFVETRTGAHIPPDESFPGLASDMKSLGEFSCAIEGAEFVTYDLRDPRTPIELARRPLSAEATRLEVAGSLVHVIQPPDSLITFDVSDPGDPVRTVGREFAGAVDVAIGDSWAAVSTLQAGQTSVLLVDESWLPAATISLPPLGQPNWIEANGSQLVLAYYPNELHVYDMSDPHSPWMMGSVSGAGNASDLVLDGPRAFLASWAGVVIIDIGDPYAPWIQSNAEPPHEDPRAMLPRVAVSGNVLYVAAEHLGMRTYDISDPDFPTYIAAMAPRGSVGFVTCGTNWLAVGAQWSSFDPDPFASLEFYPPQCDPTMVSAPSVATRRSTLVVRPPTPNPFNPRTTIEYWVRQPGMARLSVYDAAGRRVDAATRQANAGWNQWIWEGSDLDGRPVGSGVYFLLVEAQGERAAVRMTLIR